MVYYCFTNVITYCTSICKATGFVMVCLKLSGKTPQIWWLILIVLIEMAIFGYALFSDKPNRRWSAFRAYTTPPSVAQNIPKLCWEETPNRLHFASDFPFPFGKHNSSRRLPTPLHWACTDLRGYAYDPSFELYIWISLPPKKMINAFKYIQFVFSLLHSSAFCTHLLMVMKDRHGPPQCSDVNSMGKSPTTLRYPYHSPLDLILG